jgi:hypothetical protein
VVVVTAEADGAWEGQSRHRASESPCSARPAGNGGRSCSTPGTPFFPLVQSGLQGGGAEAVDGIADLELGLAQELAIGLGGKQAGESARRSAGFTATNPPSPGYRAAGTSLTAGAGPIPRRTAGSGVSE